MFSNPLVHNSSLTSAKTTSRKILHLYWKLLSAASQIVLSFLKFLRAASFKNYYTNEILYCRVNWIQIDVKIWSDKSVDTPKQKLSYLLEESSIRFIPTLLSYEMRAATWYHSYDLKNVKNTYGEVLFFWGTKNPAILLKVTLVHWCFSCFKNCANSTNSRNASIISKPLN